MAIQITHNSIYGDTYSEAYARITKLDINYGTRTATALVGIYKDEAAREAGHAPVETETVVYVEDDFDILFREVSADNLEGKINPVREIYVKLTASAGTKYESGEKLWDELADGKEVSKYEKIAKEG